MENINKIIKVKNLRKSFGDFDAVKDISFDVYEGEIFGFLGQNGAGKSTSINMITTMLTLTSGSIELAGINVAANPKDVRSQIGIVFQQQTLDESLSVEMNLKIHAKLYGMSNLDLKKRIDNVLDLVSLRDKRKERVGSLSGGQKRRVELARGLIHKPKVLFLDEPTTGLDPQTRANIWKYIVKLQKEQNMTIFLTTHYMDEADICHRIAIMEEGEIVQMGTPVQLKEKLTKNSFKFTSKDSKIAKTLINKINKKAKVLVSKNEVIVETSINSSITELITKFTKEFKGEILDLEINRPTMDDVFLSAVKEEKQNSLDRNEIARIEQDKLNALSSKERAKYKREQKKTPEFIQAKIDRKQKIINGKKLAKESMINAKADFKKSKLEYKEKYNNLVSNGTNKKEAKIEASKVSSFKGYEGQMVGLSLWVVFKRDILRWVSNTPEFMMAFIMPFMFMMIFGVLGAGQFGSFGNAIAVFIPGTIGVTAATSGLYIGISFIQDINSGFMREMLVAPIRRWELALGKIFGGLVQVMVQGLILFFLGLAIGSKTITPPGSSASIQVGYEFKDIFITLAGLFVTALSSVSISILIASKITNVKTFQSVSQLIMFPMMFFNGVYSSPDVLGAGIEWIILINPVTYASQIFVGSLTPNTIPLEVYGLELTQLISWAIFIPMALSTTLLTMRSLTKMNGAKEFTGEFMVA